MRYTRLVGAFIVAAFLNVPLLAQNASVSGQVVDPQHAVLSAATVTLTNTETQVKTRAVTNEKGDFSLPPVAPGHYAVTAAAQGFNSTVLTGITLEIGESRVLTLELKMGSVQQTVEVTSTPRS